MLTEKHYKINTDLNFIKNILIDLNLYGELHPLIKSVHKVNVTAKNYEEYLIKERPYRWIPITIKYTAQLSSKENEEDYKILGIPFTKAYIKYTLNKISDKETDVKFRLQLDGKPIGKRILLNKMIKAQNKLMKAMNDQLSTS